VKWFSACENDWVPPTTHKNIANDSMDDTLWRVLGPGVSSGPTFHWHSD
jgi:hypothetical protein